ncbi:MAG: PAS domain S-box protein [Cyanobacteria bacterium J055]|nr:MAG: PAS domain S-box protein [Cyanobacteria bacterium J055]
MVEPTTYRILLIADEIADYSCVRDRLDCLETPRCQVHWMDAGSEPENANLAGYDVYVLDDRSQEKWLNVLRERSAWVPIILLTATAERGLAALQTGIADYWAKDDLSPFVLERSLRLTRPQPHDITDEMFWENDRAFQLSDERLHGILRTTNDAVWSFDPRIDKLLYLNSAAASIYGRSLSEFLADFTLWRSCIHPDDRRAVDRADLALPETGGFEIEYRIIRPDGSLRWLRERTHLLFDETGTPVRRNSIATEIVQFGNSHAAEAALRQSEERFETLTRVVPIGIFRTDPQGNCLYVNQRWCQITGLTLDEARGTDWMRGLHPDDRDRVTAEWTHAVAADRPFQAEYRFQTAEGRVTWVLGQAVAEKDDTGTLLGYIGSITDLSDRKQAEIALHQQIERERLVTRISQHIRQSLDLDQILNTTVAEVRQLLDADRASIFRLWANKTGVVTHEAVKQGEPSTIGLRFEDEEFPPDCYRDYCQGKTRNIPDIEVDETADCLLEYLQNLNVKSRLVVPILVDRRPTPTESPLWGLLIVHQCDRIRHWQPWEANLLEQLAVQVSIALAQGQLLEDTTRTARELARSNRELEQFAYVASHDLQEPLRTVISFVQLLDEEYGDRLEGEGREYMDFIVDAATRMQQLIRDLLAFSRVGTQGSAFAPIPGDRPLDAALANLRGAIVESGAIVTRDPLPTVLADEFQLMQLFQNLIGNALKFRSRQSPRIHISVRSQTRADGGEISMAPESREWVFSVRDNGIGIDPKYAERIFAIFARLQGRQQSEGTGIGLAICQKIVRRHGGRIWVESAPECGATFYFTLPQSDL